MTLKDELTQYTKKTHKDAWSKRNGQKVPEPDDLSLGNDAVLLDGTVLYADLAESTNLVKGYKNWFAAEVYKTYLYSAARLIRSLGGSVTAYDGDRVMGVFVGSSKNTSAVKCALKINWTVENILQPAIESQYPSTKYILKQKVGIDSSDLFVARTGIRGSNDLVWVGTSANNAAKMAALSLDCPTYISSQIYNNIHKSARIGSDGRDMWVSKGYHGGIHVYASTYWMAVT